MSRRAVSTNFASAVFVGGIVAAGIGVVMVQHDVTRILLSVLLALMMVGALEAVHQATHNNLFSKKWANKWVGTALAAILLINFVRYRAFHANHHGYTATKDDPERVLYLGPSHGAIVSWVLAPVFYLQFVQAIERSVYVAKHHVGSAHRNRILIIAFIGFVLVLSAWQPITMALLYWLPLGLFAWFDYLLNQAEHYGMKEIRLGDDPGEETNNLLLPTPLAWIFLYRNLHRVHHLEPRTPWHLTGRVYRQQGRPGLPFVVFMKRYLSEGPRLWGLR